jgi:hypothetical protein
MGEVEEFIGEVLSAERKSPSHTPRGPQGRIPQFPIPQGLEGRMPKVSPQRKLWVGMGSDPERRRRGTK